jgi:hypothetical protein
MTAVLLKLKENPADLTRPVFRALWYSSLICIIFQLFLGADLTVAVTDFGCVTLGLYGLRLYSVFNAGAVLILFYSVGNVILALYVKTILLQPLDIYLFAPVTSYMAELVTVTAAILALGMVAKLNLGPPVLQAELDARQLDRLARSAALIGMAAWLESHHYHAASGDNFDGFAGFRDLLFLAVICKTASLIVRKLSRSYIDPELAALLIASMSLGFLANSKTYTFLPVIAYISTIFFFEGKISITRIAIFAASGGFFLIVVSPLIQAFRFLGQMRVNFFERLHLIASALTSPNYSTLLSRLRAHASSLYGEGYYDYFRDHANWVVIASRYASVQQIDPVIARVQLWGFQQVPVITDALVGIIPHIIYGAKLPFSTAYYILLQLGFVSVDSGKSPTLPIAGELYANGGMIEVFFGALIVFAIYFMVLKKLAWDLRRNVFAIFFFVDFTFVYASQGAVEQYINAALREFPTFAVIILLLRYTRLVSRNDGVPSKPALPAGRDGYAN